MSNARVPFDLGDGSVFKNIEQPLVELRKFLKGVENLYLCVVEERIP